MCKCNEFFVSIVSFLDYLDCGGWYLNKRDNYWFISVGVLMKWKVK